MNKLLVVAGISTILIVAAAAALALNSPPESDIVPYDDSNSTQTVSPEAPDAPSTSSSSGSSSSTSSSDSENTGTGSETEQPETNDSEDQSARINFDVSIKTLETEHQLIGKEEVLFSCYGYISWEPVTYVRYYEVTPNFNGNNMPNEDRYSGSNYRLWGTEGHELVPFPWSDNETLVVGPQSVAHMFPKIYKGPCNASGTWVDTNEDGSRVYGPHLWPDTQHGVKVIGIMATFNREDWQEDLSPTQIAQIETQMRQFLAEYVRGWTFSIRAVS